MSFNMGREVGEDVETRALKAGWEVTGEGEIGVVQVDIEIAQQNHIRGKSGEMGE